MSLFNIFENMFYDIVSRFHCQLKHWFGNIERETEREFAWRWGCMWHIALHIYKDKKSTP